MEDEKIKERRKEFGKKSIPKITQERLDYALKLRKDKKDVLLNQKRTLSSSKDSVEYVKFLESNQLGSPLISIVQLIENSRKRK